MTTALEKVVFVPLKGYCGCGGGSKHKCKCDDPPNPVEWEFEEKEIVSSDDDEGDEYDKEFHIYSRQIRESEGYHVDKRRPGSTLLGGIMPLEIEDKDLFEETRIFTELAIKNYNERENANLEFVDLVKANYEGVEGVRYYITFLARDSSGETRRYQALVWDAIWETVVQQFRPEPIKQGDPKKSRLNDSQGVLRVF